MFVVCVVIVMSNKAQDEKAVYDAARQGKIDVIKALFEKGTNLNGYKDCVSKPVTFSLLTHFVISMIFMKTLIA
jgi:hypothetical protein